MTAPRTPEQRASFVRSVASDLDVAPELAERLLFLSEAARGHVRGAIGSDTVRALLDCLLDDDVCRYGWRVVEDGGTGLWRLLLSAARPPRDVGPAVLLAYGLARAGAAGEASNVLGGVLRAGEFRRTALEVAADLAEDAGRAALAWSRVVRLGLADQAAEWDALRCVLGCSRRGPCDRARLPGVVHARWLRRRVLRWARRPWSAPAGPQDAGPAGYLAARRSVLPAAEQELLRRWTRTPPSTVTLGETSIWYAVVDGPDRRGHSAGWDSGAPPDAAPGVAVWCLPLPTLVPDQLLLAGTTPGPVW